MTVEHNVYFDPISMSVDHLEGEDWQFVEMTTDGLTSSSTIPQTASTISQTTLPIDKPLVPAESEPGKNKPCARCTCKPSQRVLEILSGCAVNSSCPSDPLITPGVQVPTAIVEEPEGEQTPDALMAVDLIEYAMVAEMSEAEGLEPHSLAEAK